jgi:hypothetical protein
MDEHLTANAACQLLKRPETLHKIGERILKFAPPPKPHATGGSERAASGDPFTQPKIVNYVLTQNAHELFRGQ